MKTITTFKTNNGSPITGLTPLITITDITDMESPVVVIAEEEMHDIGSGFYGYIFAAYDNTKEYTVFIDADENVPTRYQYGLNDIAQISENADRIRNIEEGNWKIEGNQMLFYDLDGVEMFRFNLFDKNGNPSSENVYFRNRV